MDEHEVYPNAPVVLVALEVRHPTAEPLSTEHVRKIKDLLGSEFPLESSAQAINGQLIPGAQSQPELSFEPFTRFFNRARTAAISFRRGAIIVESSDYPGWDRFREFIALALAARKSIAPVDGVERVGLRYIDEVRVPIESGERADWSQWIAPSLLGPPADAVDLPLEQWQGMGVYNGGEGRTLVVRYGPRLGFAVDPNSDLRSPKPRDGDWFFLVDIDSFWTPQSEIPEFDDQTLLAQCVELHAPVRRLFEAVITDRLRSEVLRVND